MIIKPINNNGVTVSDNEQNDFSLKQGQEPKEQEQYERYLQKYLRHPAYRNFIGSLKSYSTKNNYSFNLAKYLNTEVNRNLSLDDILAKNPKDIESEIIQEIIKQQEVDKLGYSSSHIFLSSLTHFFAINDIVINRRKIKKFLGENTLKFEYRSYTTEEISRMLEICDKRDRVVVFILASTGMRVGGLADIKLQNLNRWIIDIKGTHVYQITVYANSQKSKYQTFCTPEAAKAIDEYLELRKRCGENLKQDPNTGNWLPRETHLIIKQFDKTGYIHSIEPISPLNINIKIMLPKLHQLGIRKKTLMTELSLPLQRGKTARIRHELHPCHSLRIFAITQMQRAHLDKTIREMLVGHDTGLDKIYYKPQDEEILQEYLKAVDLLTISNENRLQKQVDYYKSRADRLEEMAMRLDNIEKKWASN